MSPINTSHSARMPVLIVDSNVAAASLLADQLSHSGFPAEFATSCTAAQATVRARHFGILVATAELSDMADRQCLTRLRAIAPSTWIIVISAQIHLDTQRLAF